MAPPLGAHTLAFSLGHEEIDRRLDEVVEVYETSIDSIVKDHEVLKEKNASAQELFSATFKRLTDADGYASLRSAELTLPALVSGDLKARAASSEAKKRLKAMWDSAYARPDLFSCLNGIAKEGRDPACAEDARVVEVVLARFKQSGATIRDDDQRTVACELDAQCTALAFQIEQNINEDTSEVAIKEADLEGLSESFISGLAEAKDNNGNEKQRMCSVKAPILLPILTRATNEDTRRTMLQASQSQCIDRNSDLLNELLATRHKAALALGFPNHAERMLSVKMAGSAKEATQFCTTMLRRLAPLRDTELGRLARAKAEMKMEEDGPSQKKRKSLGPDINQWDTTFLSDLLLRKEFDLDDEKVKEFFPLEGTIERLLQVYSDLLGFSFVKLKDAHVWHPEVVCFETRQGGELVGHLYLDQFPRKGKFGHQMVVPLAPSFTSASGERCLPACVNISNLPRPEGDKPALLRFKEMQTLFHELGHAMHCLCTTSRYSVLSWAWPMVPWPGGVEQDFLELPSMALEKFATDPEMVQRVAQHFSGDKSLILPEDTIHKLQKMEKWMVGTKQTKYFAMALFDMIVHSQAPPYTFNDQSGLSIQQLFAAVLERHTKLTPIPDTHPCASWYHLVIGYDAGYYGYGWSDVYAADVFAHMRANSSGLLSSKTGTKLRDEILAPCATRNASNMLRTFLGRAPDEAAWCERNGVGV